MTTTATRRARLCLALTMLIIAPVGCGKKNYLNENDRLRAQNLALQQEVDRLERSLDARLLELSAADASATQPSADAPAELPTLTNIDLDRYTSAVDLDNDGRDDAVRIYVRTFDQKGRFLLTAGSVDAQLVLIQPGTEPVVLTERHYDAYIVDQAYRSGFLGTHHSLDLPLPDVDKTKVSGDKVETTLKVVFTDARHGRSFEVQKPVLLRLPTR
ncbi:MAG: hypothetical protein IT441_03945 [Phycisphaeraceae bacterium]|nr:hypothetical protein [Phycisphaeraceae bacterium]